jgi:methionyl-tRNA formyltransferase
MSTTQDEGGATFAAKISKEEGRLSLKDDGQVNWRKYRAFLESPGTYFYAQKDGRRVRVKILDAALEKGGVFTIKRVVPESKSEQEYATLIRNGWVPE